MLAFTTVLLAILWIFQTVYLDDFYKSIKMNELDNAVENVESVVDDNDFSDAVETISKSYDICIIITDISGNTITSADQNINCILHRISKTELLRLYGIAMENDGEYLLKDDAGIYEDMIKNHDKNNMFQDNNPENLTPVEQETGNDTANIPEGQVDDRFTKMPNMPALSEAESVMMIKVLTKADGTHFVAYFNSVITPIGATVHTLRIQLIYISIIMVILSLVIAFLISLKIAKPIANITNSAKELAKGDYDVKFQGQGYLEIEELSDTLNYTANELGKAENLQRELIANVSHDLRTPITMITGYAEVMRDLPGENTPENVQIVIDEAKRLTNLVNDLLDISKLQSGVTNLELKEYDLTESIKSVIDRYAKLVEQNGYTIEFDYDENVKCIADEFKIYQVIYNLVNNAINYSGEAKYVKVRQIVSGSIVRIEVIDKGEGIEEDKLKNVWERYYKIDKKHKRAVMGTGLGLSIVKNILKLHNANYGVESKVSKGSTFWFELKINK